MAIRARPETLLQLRRAFPHKTPLPISQWRHFVDQGVGRRDLGYFAFPLYDETLDFRSERGKSNEVSGFSGVE
jgi:hypothetical protein